MSKISVGDIIVMDELGHSTLVMVSSVKGQARQIVRGYTKGCRSGAGEEIKYLSTKKRAILHSFTDIKKYKKKDALVEIKIKKMLSSVRSVEGVNRFLLVKWTYWVDKEMITEVSREAIANFLKRKK